LAGTAALAALALDTKTAFARTNQTPGNMATGPSSGGSTTKPLQARSSDGTFLAGEAQGDPQAREILFIHGLRQSRLSWDRQFADKTLADFRMVRFDLRGHGDSDKPTALDAYSDADRWADDVAAVIAEAGLRRPVLVGWSLGGFVAGAYLRKYGGAKVAGFNLVDAVTRLSPDLLTSLAGTFTKTTTSHDLAERAAATAEFLFVCFHRLPTGIELQRMLIINGMTPRAVNEGFVKTKTTDLEPLFQNFAGPILLTHGKHDRLVRTTMSQRIRAIHGNSRLSIFANSGHSPFYEEPGRFNRELAAFAKAATKG
jgi:non-heme chloroperoxidase